MPHLWTSGTPTVLSFLRASGGFAFWSWSVTRPYPTYVPGLHGSIYATNDAFLVGLLQPGEPRAIFTPTLTLPPTLLSLPVHLQAYFVDLGPLRVTAGPPATAVLVGP